MTVKEQMVKGPPEGRARSQGSENQRGSYEEKFPQMKIVNSLVKVS